MVDWRPEVSGSETGDGAPGADGDPHPGRRRFVIAVLGVVIALILAMWVYAFGFADSRSLYRVSDREWAVNGETRCATAVKELDALADFRRIDQVGPGAIEQKAAIVDKANDIVVKMVDDLSVGAPARSDNGSDAQKWIADYRTYLGDRREFRGQVAPRRGQAVLRVGDQRRPDHQLPHRLRHRQRHEELRPAHRPRQLTPTSRRACRNCS